MNASMLKLIKSLMGDVLLKSVYQDNSSFKYYLVESETNKVIKSIKQEIAETFINSGYQKFYKQCSTGGIKYYGLSKRAYKDYNNQVKV